MLNLRRRPLHAPLLFGIRNFLRSVVVSSCVSRSNSMAASTGSATCYSHKLCVCTLPVAGARSVSRSLQQRGAHHLAASMNARHPELGVYVATEDKRCIPEEDVHYRRCATIWMPACLAVQCAAQMMYRGCNFGA